LEFNRIRKYDTLGKGDIYRIVIELFGRGKATKKRTRKSEITKRGVLWQKK